MYKYLEINNIQYSRDGQLIWLGVTLKRPRYRRAVPANGNNRKTVDIEARVCSS